VKKLEIVTLNEKGQVTIPAKIRRNKGLRRGMRIAIIEVGERIELVAIPEDPIQGLIGLGSKLPGIEEVEAEADVE